MKNFKTGRVPLIRALSKLGFGSRAQAKGWIEAGLVKVHGTVEKNPERMVNPDTAHIEVEGQKVVRSETILIAFHKPKGVLTTRTDPEGRATIYSVLPDEYQTLHAVGRLDMQTTGLLLLTNNTKLSSFLTEPKNEVEREYIAKVRGQVSEATLKSMKSGMEVDGDTLQAEVTLLKGSDKESTLRLVLKRGKNREIRRLCLAFGHEVTFLKRTRYGEFALGELEVGQIRILDENSIKLV